MGTTSKQTIQMETSSKKLNRALASNHSRTRRTATRAKTTKRTKTNSMGELDKRFFTQTKVIPPTQLTNLSEV